MNFNANVLFCNFPGHIGTFVPVIYFYVLWTEKIAIANYFFFSSLVYFVCLCLKAFVVMCRQIVSLPCTFHRCAGSK